MSRSRASCGSVFNEQYSLTFTEETEIRYRTETHVDPETGEETEEEVPYEWRILNVKLTATPLENLAVSRMNEEQKEICEILLQTKGNRQYVKNCLWDKLAALCHQLLRLPGTPHQRGKELPYRR